MWERQPKSCFEEAIFEMDGTLVETDGEKKEGIDIAYDGKWGYHPLILSLANTGEILSIVNRSGNRPSHEGAAAETDRAINLCRRAGFRRIRLRGDTDFTQTAQLDRWDTAGVTFVFQVKERIVEQRQFKNLRLVSEDVAEMEYRPAACKKSYRLIVVRKNLERRDGQGQLFHDCGRRRVGSSRPFCNG